jgi:hypothetical protein
MRSNAHSTGLTAPVEQGCDPSGRFRVRPPGSEWITDDMIEDTRRHWSPRYGYELSDDEAVEILMNIKRFGELLIRTGGVRP